MDRGADQLAKPAEPGGTADGMTGRGIASGLPATDVASIAKEQLKTLQREIPAAIGRMQDSTSRYHLQDCLDRINRALHIG